VLNERFYRDVSEFKTRIDSYSREMLRKEATIRDLQGRLENGDGSEYHRWRPISAVAIQVSLQMCI